MIENNFLVAPAGKIDQQIIGSIKEDLIHFLKFKKSMSAFGRHKIHLLIPSIYDLVFDKALNLNVEKFVGKKCYMWYSVLFNKPKETKQYVPWHYDDYFWNIKGKGCTVWVAINDVDLTMGPMEFAFDSKVSNFKHEINNDPNNILVRGNIAKYEPSEDIETVKVPLKSGEYSIHSNTVMHRSGINTSNRDRLAFAFRYIEINAKPQSFLFLKRGVVSNQKLEKFFYKESKPLKIEKPLKTMAHIKSVLISTIITFFGDTNRGLMSKIKDLFKFVFSKKIIFLFKKIK